MRDIKIKINEDGYGEYIEHFIGNQYENDASQLIFELPSVYMGNNYFYYVMFTLPNNKTIVRQMVDNKCIIDRDITNLGGVILLQVIVKNIKGADDLSDGLVMCSQPISCYINPASYNMNNITNESVDKNIIVLLDQFDALLAEIRTIDSTMKNYKTELDNTIANISNNTTDLAEVIDARGNFTNLGSRLDAKPYYFENVDTMKSSNLKAGDFAITNGYYDVNDGGNGIYKIVSGKYDDDGGSYHELSNGLFAMLVNEQNYLIPEQFGAKGNGITDDTTAFIKMLDFAKAQSKKSIKLSNFKNYIINTSLPLFTNLKVFSDIKSLNAKLIFNSEYAFYIPEENSNTRIYNITFENIQIEGNGTNSCFKSSELQYWLFNITNLKFLKFSNIFENIKLYASRIVDTEISEINKVGIIGGSDNVIEKNIITGLSDETRNEYLLIFENLYLTQIAQNFLTGSLEVDKGVKSIININGCKDLNIFGNWFDYCDFNAIYCNESSFIDIHNNMFRGNARNSNSNNYINVIKGSNNIKFRSNKFLNVHQSTQNLNAIAYRIFDYTGFISHDIYIDYNLYEHEFYYDISFTNGYNTKNIIINDNNKLFLDTSLNIMPKFNINSYIGDFSYFQNTSGEIVLNGKSNSALYILLIGSIEANSDDILTLKANSSLKIKTSDLNPGISMILHSSGNTLFNKTNDDTFITEEDVSITGIRLRIPAGTYENCKINPMLILQ